MNFTTLEYFLVTAEELNITRAAARLFISQQALSGHIHKLERELGISLFDRSPNLTLTFAGKQMVEYSSQIVNLEHHMHRTAADMSNNMCGELKIGISHTCGRAILPSILPEFHKSHPHIDLRILEGNSSELENFLHSGELDLIISFAPFSLEKIASKMLIEERLLLVVPRRILEEVCGPQWQDMRSALSQNLDLNLFKGQPFILLKKGNRARALVDTHMEKIGFKPKIILEIENTETAFALAQRGMGITVYPELFHLCIPHPGDEEQQSVALFPLPDEDTIGKLEIGWLKNRYQTRAAMDFVSLCTGTLQDFKMRQEQI